MKGIQKVWNGPCPVCNNTKHHRDDCYVERLLNHLQSSPVQDKPKLPSSCEECVARLGRCHSNTRRNSTKCHSILFNYYT
jgi:hypothetical protein